MSFLQLSKGRLSALVLLTTALSFAAASRFAVDTVRLAWALTGTLLASWGANSFNQIMERRRDSLMTRTLHRPLATGILGLREALVWAAVTSLLGPGLLAAFVSPLAAALALLAQTLYVAVYTPLKTRTSLCTLVGGIVGAIPPLIGWAGAVNRLETGAWLLAAILFVWQIPHFLALAWMYREDYARAGFRMLPTLDASGIFTSFLVVIYSLALFPLTLAVASAGLAGWFYAGGSLILGLWLFAVALRLFRERTRAGARRVFLATIAYLPLVLLLMILDPHAPRSARSAAGSGMTTPSAPAPAP